MESLEPVHLTRVGRDPARAWRTCCHSLLLAAGQGQVCGRLGAPPCHPSLTQCCPYNFGSAPGALSQGAGRSPVKAGLVVASACPAANLPLAPALVVGPVAGACPQALLTGKPGCTRARSMC